MGEKETEEDKAEVIHNVCCIQNALRHVVKVLEKGNVVQDIFPYSTRRASRPVQDPEEEKSAKSQHGRDNLVFCERREEDADGNERGTHQEKAQIAVEDGSEFRVSVRKCEERENAGQKKHHEEHKKGGEKFAQDNLVYRDRRGVEQFIGLPFLFFGEEAHGEKRNREKEYDADVVEQGRVDHLIDVELLDGFRVS